MNNNSVGKGVAYLYIESITMLFSGYIYWLIISKITDPSIIGMSSTVISVVTIFVAVASIGVSGGIQRFLGKSITINNLDNIKRIINSSFLILGVGLLGTFLAMFIMREWIYESFRIDPFLLIMSMILVSAMVISGVLRSIIIPTLKVRIITISSVIATIIKIVSTIILLIADTGVVGILVGFTLYPLISIIFFVVYIKKTIYPTLPAGNFKSLFSSVYDIFIAGTGFWIPTVVSTIGSQLGTISVFLSIGTSQAGIYFIALSIVSGVTVIITVLSTIAYPTVSSMTDGRKRASWKLIKISLLLTLPLSVVMIFYSSDVLSLFGSDYLNGSGTLGILFLSILPTTIFTGIGVLAYSYGNNKQFLSIGLFTSLPRVLLYFLFVPLFGGAGAALAYTIGSVVGFAYSLILCSQLNMKLEWRRIISILLIPILIALPFKIISLNFILSIFLILTLSYLVFLKSRMIEDEDIQELSKILPKPLQKRIIMLINIIKGEKRKV
jgi:O-antigen/teichoic acid export membrane protein